MSFRALFASTLLVLAATASGCGTAATAARPEADLARTVESLRAQNAAYARKVEELENQVFLLNGELDARRPGEVASAAAAPVPAPPPALPEVKLARGERPPEVDPAADPAGERPQSLVEEAAIEYAGAAAERSGKRPLLRLWGAPSDAGQSPEMVEVEAPRAPAHARQPGPAARPAAVRDESRTGPRSDPGEAGLRMYQLALDHLRNGRHDEAVATFRGFVKQHPQHDLADNAQYWLGECYYDRKDYSTALREFRRVAERFPQGNKAPDALLKVAFSYLALGSARPARETLQEIIRSYPRHQAAGLARAKLGELEATTVSATGPAGTGRAGARKEIE
jgi:tol-pal system protein YbgF